MFVFVCFLLLCECFFILTIYFRSIFSFILFSSLILPFIVYICTVLVKWINIEITIFFVLLSIFPIQLYLFSLWCVLLFQYRNRFRMDVVSSIKIMVATCCRPWATSMRHALAFGDGDMEVMSLPWYLEHNRKSTNAAFQFHQSPTIYFTVSIIAFQIHNICCVVQAPITRIYSFIYSI